MCLTYIIYCECDRQLHSSRPPLPDVPAVYFVSPTLPNIRRIAEDLDKALYESFHVNFSEPLSRSLLEELAASVARDNTGELIEEVCPVCASYSLRTVVPTTVSVFRLWTNICRSSHLQHLYSHSSHRPHHLRTNLYLLNHSHHTKFSIRPRHRNKT